MAYFANRAERFIGTRSVRIVGSETIDSHTVYLVQVTVDLYHWIVRHRYSDFFELNEKLITECKLDRSLLPPKKIFGNQTESFVRKRQGELEVYLQTVMHCFANIPQSLALFLHFDKYEIHYITQHLTEELFTKGEMVLQTGELFAITALQLHAFTERLKLAEPTCESGDKRKDLGHALDFICRLKYLEINSQSEPIESSNIYMNQLPFDLSSFKSLTQLQIQNCNPSMIQGVEHLRKFLMKLHVHHTVNAIKDILLCDIAHWIPEEPHLVPPWQSLYLVDFSQNDITYIDESVNLLKHVEILNLSHNKIEKVENLQCLYTLTHLDLSHNNISYIHSLHTKLGNIKTLNLAYNKLGTLQGLAKLYSLVNLDVSYNEISVGAELSYIKNLPCLETLNLIGNHVTIMVDYRTKVLVLFGERASEANLDNMKATQKELDTVAVLLALQKAKEKTKKQPNKPPTEAAIWEPTMEEYQVSASRKTGNITQKLLECKRFSDDPGEFRQQVESIRQVGGESWLRVLNDIQSSLDQPVVNENHLNNPSHESVESAKYVEQSSEEDSPNHNCNNNRDPNDWCLQKANALPDHLPDSSCFEFLEYVQKLISKAGKFIKMNNSEDIESIKVITWATIICYLNPNCEIPSCVIVTNKCLHIFELIHPESPRKKLPKLKLLHGSPLQNIERFVISLNWLNLRIEESFQGASGTFTLIVYNKELMENLLAAFVDSYSSRLLNLGISNAPNLIQMDQNYLHYLKETINFVEKNPDPIDLKLVLNIHIYCLDNQDNFCAVITRDLILTKDFVHLVKENWFVSPKPIFEITEDTKKQFEIIDSFPVSNSINDIHLFEVEVPWNSSDVITLSKSKNSIFGIKLTFQHLSPNTGLSYKTLNICMQTRELRDLFLENLTRVRQECTNKYKAPIEFTSLAKLRTGPPQESSDKPVRQSSNQCVTVEASENILPISSKINKIITEENKNLSVRSTDPPKSLSLITNHSKSFNKIWEKLSPTTDLNSKKIWIKNIPPISEISTPMQHLATMSPEKLTDFLKEIGIHIDSFNEDLLLGMFTAVIPYTSPNQEIISCIILTTKAIYFLSDTAVHSKDTFNKTHHRYQSDSAVVKTIHLDSWTMGDHSLPRTLTPVKSVKCYNITPLQELREVVIGLFDQKFRLASSTTNQIFTCITRDTEQTALFIQTLKSALTNHITTPSPQPKDGFQESDFYSQYNPHVNRTDSGVYMHPSKVKFVCQGEEAIREFTFLIHENMKGLKPKLENISLLVYILGLQREKGIEPSNSSVFIPRTILLTSSHVGLSIDDHVQYPIPDFVITVPDDPPMQIAELRQIEYLKRIISIPDSHDIILVFEDENEDFLVDVTKEYYTAGDETMAIEPPKEVQWDLRIRNRRDKDRLLRWLCKLYAETQGSQVLLTTCLL